MKSRVSERWAARHWPEMIDRVYSNGESFIVARGGRPVCEVVPAQRPFRGRDLAELLKSLPKPDEEYLEIIEDLISQQRKPAN